MPPVQKSKPRKDVRVTVEIIRVPDWKPGTPP